jgi:hypothetical protein
MSYKYLIPALLFLLLFFPAAKNDPAWAGSFPFFWGVALDGYPITTEKLALMAQEIRVKPQMALFYLQWPKSPVQGDFPKNSLEAIWRQGAVPCLSWEPMFIDNGREITIAAERILQGEYDPYLRRMTNGVNSWGKQVIIRFAHEMNLERYHWGTDKTGYGPQSSEKYKEMFRYLVTFFRKAGVNNVWWAFCPNSESIPNPAGSPEAAWNRPEAYYPGDDFVDLLGMDGYNWGTTQTLEKHGWQSNWRSFKEIFSPLYQVLKTLAPQKPLLVFEIATTHQGGDKKQWIGEALTTSREWGLLGIIWFQANKEQDWRINSQNDYSYVSQLQSSISPEPQQWFSRTQSR